jgi:hypothetical protein
VTILHVTNGDSTVAGLRASGITDAIVAWRDVLHVGPVPADEPLREVRARYLAAAGLAVFEEALAGFAARDAALADHDGEIRLWFEADLYDQLQLIEILSRLDGRTVELVCIGEFAGKAHFGGLGELSGPELAGLTGAPVTAAGYDLAVRAWSAFRSDSPIGWASLEPSGELRFLNEAFDRLAREYPSTRDGLSLTERRILAALWDGPLPRAEVFRRVWRREARPFFGDSPFFGQLAELSGLVELEPEPDFGMVSLTDDGRRVLSGRADRLDLIGIDRWIGGVHLTGGQWRFDEGRETIVSL